ncbi:putative DNA methylase-type I restriction-modification system [uncultured delta proteobacterium]|uniref:Putative DNA methylase-type I restriction-modification system n=1 Tax=uncultured delta proteobacterium TaxID=34034 RepID=A0A212K365_9DELT|nr:putative DNA methylase-type I restriction-modification system [uncultured delta proteobacterium]
MQYSVVARSSITGSVFGDRIDAEFYLPQYLERDALLEKTAHAKLRALVSKIDVGHVGPMTAEYAPSGVWLIQTQNVREFFLDETKKIAVNEDFHRRRLKSHVIHNDILIARSGSFGSAAVYLGDTAVNCSDIIIIRAIETMVDPLYLVAFLNSAFGREQLCRFASGGLQGHVNLTILENLKIALFPLLQNLVARAVAAGYRDLQKAASLYEAAQADLMAELGVSGWNPEHRLSFIARHAEARRAGRLDAEYFQPKYSRLIGAITRYPGGCATLGSLFSIHKCVEVGSAAYREEGVPFVRVSNLSPFGITEEKYITPELYEKLRHHQPRQGEILLSKDATPGIACYLCEPPRTMLPAGGILRLAAKKDVPRNALRGEVAALVMNSPIVREQIQRDVGGSVIPHWRPDQVAATLLPVLADAAQNALQKKLMESSALRERAKTLLESAKRAIETAVTRGEADAAGFLAAELRRLSVSDTTRE